MFYKHNKDNGTDSRECERTHARRKGNEREKNSIKLLRSRAHAINAHCTSNMARLRSPLLPNDVSLAL